MHTFFSKIFLSIFLRLNDSTEDNVDANKLFPMMNSTNLRLYAYKKKDYFGSHRLNRKKIHVPKFQINYFFYRASLCIWFSTLFWLQTINFILHEQALKFINNFFFQKLFKKTFQKILKHWTITDITLVLWDFNQRILTSEIRYSFGKSKYFSMYICSEELT